MAEVVWCMTMVLLSQDSAIYRPHRPRRPSAAYLNVLPAVDKLRMSSPASTSVPAAVAGIDCGTSVRDGRHSGPFSFMMVAVVGAVDIAREFLAGCSSW